MLYTILIFCKSYEAVGERKWLCRVPFLNKLIKLRQCEKKPGESWLIRLSHISDLKSVCFFLRTSQEIVFGEQHGLHWQHHYHGQQQPADESGRTCSITTFLIVLGDLA